MARDLLSLDMDMSPESVIITEVPKGFRDMDMEDTIKELLNLDITTDMVIHMFIKTETIIMVHMDMKLNMITKNDLLKLSQATAMVAIAISM